MNRGKIDTHKTHIHYRALSWPDTGTAIKSGGIKLVEKKTRGKCNPLN